MLSDLEILTIRTIKSDDLPDLEWNGEFTHFRRVYANAFQNQQKGNAILWVAELNGKIVGQAFVQLIGSRLDLADGHNRAYIYSVRVQKKHRNHGIGTRIMVHAENDIFQRGYRYATLNVGKHNRKARRFYERLGYKVIGDEPGRWSYIDHRGKRQHVREPAWRMIKSIARPSDH